MKNLSARSALYIFLAFACVPTVMAQPQFQSWFYGTIPGDEGVYAATVNDSNGVIGQYCYKDGGNCIWLLKTDIECTESHKYPVLVNTEAGAANMQLLCIKTGGQPRYAFTDFESINNLITSSSNIGIAFPMENGRFQVSRFSLAGAVKAISYMRDVAAQIVKPKKNSGTKDERL